MGWVVRIDIIWFIAIQQNSDITPSVFSDNPRLAVHFDAATYPREKERIMRELGSARPGTLDGAPVARAVLLDTKDGAKFFRQDGSWLLIRLSGTEPLVRIYAETRDPKELAPLLDAGEKLIGVKR